MTIEEARKVARLVRTALGREPMLWTLEGAVAALRRTFPEFEWELRGLEIVVFERHSAGTQRSVGVDRFVLPALESARDS